MSEIISNITLSPITATFVIDSTNIGITPEGIDLTISSTGQGPAKAVSANIANVHIYQGTNGQFLQTDGAGNLSWVSGGGSGNGVVGGSNTQVQFNDAGIFGGDSDFTFNKSTGNLVVPTLMATQANISNVVITGNGINTPGYYGDITGGNLFSAYTMNASIQINTANLVANVITANYISTGSNVIGNISITDTLSSNTVSANTVSANTVSSNTISASGNITTTTGIGYEAGAGGTVTQLISRTTSVTLNKPTGVITLFTASLASNTQQQFVLDNSYITATDMVVVQHISGGTMGLYSITATAGTGNATIVIRNNSSLTSGSQTPVLKFMILRAVTS